MISPGKLSHPLSLESLWWMDSWKPHVSILWSKSAICTLILRLFKSLQAIKERDQEKKDKRVDEKNRLTNLLIFTSTLEMQVKETKIMHQNVFEEKLHSLNPSNSNSKGNSISATGWKIIAFLLSLTLKSNMFSLASFHGHTVKITSHRRNTATLLPSTFITAYMEALNPGTWLLNCMNSQFFDNGMSALFNVTTDCGKGVELPSVAGGETRIYYIAADEVIWNYGPTGENNIDGASLTSPKRYRYHYHS